MNSRDSMLQDIEKINDTTYKVEWSADAKVEFGGGDVDKFLPIVSFSRFGGLANLHIKYPVGEEETTVTGVDKIVWENGKDEVHFYPLEKNTFEKKDGGFEIEFILRKKPISNKITLKYSSKNLRFMKQLAYDKQVMAPIDIAAGVVDRTPTEGKNKNGDVIVRVPENMINSYSVYYTKAKRIYSNAAEAEQIRAGKAFCIPRLKATDAGKNEVWLDQDFEQNGNYVITMPQDFLDKAKYPIIVDPTFGYTTLPTGSSISFEDVIVGNIGTPAEAGTVDTLHLALTNWSNGEAVKMALYTSPGDALVANSESTERSDGGSGWQTFQVSGTANLTTQQYAVMAWSGSTVEIWRDAGSGTNAYYELSQTYGSWPSSISSSADTNNYGTYCTYGTVTYEISGVTKDKNGNTLGTCECFLFKMNAGEDDATFIDHDQSDSSGNYSFTGLTDDDAKYFVVAWKDNTPHVFDCTDHVLVPTEE